MPRQLRGAPAVALSLALATALGGIALAGPSSAAAKAPTETSAAITAGDSDGDSLLDTWETDGYDANGDGVIDVDLPALGANPQRKDIFVEMDYMAGRIPSSTTAWDRIAAVFASAPVANPDGSTGISIHLDAGTAAAGTQYDLGGGNQVPYDANLRPSTRETNQIKAANFDSDRAAIFYYMLWADDYDGSCSSGTAFAIPNDTFIVTMGPRCRWNVTQDMQVGTFIHELGHNLGLKHGGSDHVNYKPNYLSVMNYSFQFGGVPLSAGGSYFGYSDTATIALNERSLSEPTGLGASASKYKTIYYCGTTKTTTPGAASNPISWNCDGDSTDTGLVSDLNKDNTTGTLTAQDNWDNVVFGGGAIGGAGAKVAVTREGLTELTRQQVAHLMSQR